MLASTRAIAVMGFFGLLTASTLAQTVALYTYSQSNGSYVPIVAGTVLGTEANAAQKFVDPAAPLGGTTSTGVGFPIGFPFTFAGTAYDRLAISTDGWISLGQSALGSTAVNMPTSTVPLSTTTAVSPAQLRCRIAAFARDIRGKGIGSGSDLRIQTIGTTPNQVCVIQWSNYERSSGTVGANGDILNYQIRLNENNNVVEVAWGSCAFGAGVVSTIYPQVGLGGQAASDFNNRTTTTDWNATTAGATNTATCAVSNSVLGVVAVPANGLYMTWTGANCTPPAATATATTDCPNGQFNISVNLTSVGTGATTVDIVETVNAGTPTVVHDDVSTLQAYAMGPYALGASVLVTVRHGNNAVCDLVVGTFTKGIADCPVTSYPYCEDFNNFNECGTTASPCNNNCVLVDGWSNSSTDGADWKSHAGTTPSSPTGPSDDITGGGKYLYIEESSPCSNLTAELFSNEYDVSSFPANAEIAFNYHMQGTEMGVLTLAVEDPAGSNNFTTLFTRSGDQGAGDTWLFSNWLTVSNPVGPLIRFRFTGTTLAASTGLGDMAIDQVCVREQLCISPAATASVVNSDCTSGTYGVQVNVTTLGDAATIDLVPSIGTPINGVAAPGLYLLGPFTLGSPVSVTVEHNGSAQCNLALGSFNSSLNCITNGACALALTIPDNGCASNNRLNIGIPMSGLGGTQLGNDITFNSIELIAAHLANNHIEAFLTSPNGVTVNLLGTGFFGTGDNLGDPITCPNTTLELQDGGTPLTTTATNNANGVFAPFSPLAAFHDGSNPNGTWILQLCDDLSGTIGTLVHAQLNFLTCSAPSASTSVVPDCGNNQFSVDVNLTSLGTATNVDITTAVNGGAATLVHNDVSSLQVYTVGPFASGDDVVIAVLHNQAAACNLTLPSVTLDCPVIISTYPYCQTYNSFAVCNSTSSCSAVTCALQDGWSNELDALASEWYVAFGNGGGGSLNTGASSDNPNGPSTGTGNYLQIESGSCANRVVTLHSPAFNVGAFTGDVRTTYWRHMFGATMGTVRLDVEDPALSNNWVTLATNSGDQGNNWLFSGNVDYNPTGSQIRFRVVATVGTSFTSDMAIDDFCVTEAICDQPVASGTVVTNCANSTFGVDVDLTSLGTATDVDIVESVNGGATVVVHDNVSTLQTYVMGPYALASNVVITILHNQFPICDLNVGTFTSADVTCLDCGTGTPVNEIYCYVASDLQTWSYSTSGPGVIQLTFNRGTIESSNFDDLTIYDGPDDTSPILFSHTNTTAYNLGPVGSAINNALTTYYSVNVFSSGTTMFMKLTTDGSVHCSNTATYDPFNWDTKCIDCLAPIATAIADQDCGTNTFTVNVGLTSTGSGPTVDIVTVVNGGAPTVVHDNVSTLQNYVLGPYAPTDVVVVGVAHANNSSCDLALGSFTGDATCITCGAAALSETYCYTANDNENWLYYADGTGQLRLRFTRGTIESSNFDDLAIYDGPDNTYPVLFVHSNTTTYNLGAPGSAINNTLQTYYSVDVTASGQYLYMEMSSDGSVQCGTTATYDPWLWEVFCFDCVEPTATGTLVPDCANSQFFVDVNLTGLGDATNVDITTSVNGGAAVVAHNDVSTLQVYQVGPFASQSNVQVRLVHNQDALCNTTVGNFTTVCPPTLACGAYSASPNLAIPDPGFVLSTIVTGPLPGQYLTDLDVVVKVNHTDNADLDIQLTSPGGVVIDLINDQCSAGDGIEIRFDDEALTTVTCASPTTNVTTGRYRTSGTLADLLGTYDYTLFEGTWTLRVTDDLSTDAGTLVQWCLIPTLVTPDCANPSALAVTATTTSTATLNWTSGAGNTGYSIEYGPTGFVLGTGTIVTGSLPPPVVIGPLASATTYQFYLTETCPAGNSLQIGPVSGTTQVEVTTYPYCQDFEAFPLSPTFTCATVHAPPLSSGWINENEGATGTDWLTDENGTGSVVTGPSVDHTLGTTAGNYMYVEASTCANRVARLRSPLFDVSGMANQPIVSFWYHMCGNDGAMGSLTLEVEVPIGSNNWSTVFTRSGQDPDQTTEAAPWKQVSVPLPGLAFDQIGFRITGTTLGTGFEGDMAIDDFCVTESACFLPQASVGQNCPDIFTFQTTVDVLDIGPHTSVDVTDNFGNSVLGVGVGSYTLGTHGNNTNVVVTLTSTSDPTCSAVYNFTGNCAPAPTDDCSQAVVLPCGAFVSGSTTGMSNTLPPSACPFLGSPSLGGVNWWRFNTVSDQEVTVSTCNLAAFDSRISIFEANPDCSNLTCVSFNDNAAGCSGNSSELSFLAVAGVEYYIAIHGFAAASGSYSLSITCAAPCQPITANDNCAQAAVLVPVLNDGLSTPATGHNTCAFVDGNPTCNLTGNVQGVWYTFNSGVNTEMSITLVDQDLNGSYTATALSYVLYDGVCNVLTATGEIACDVTGEGYDQPLPTLSMNTDYLLLVYNVGGIGTEGTFGIELAHPAQNDASIDDILYPDGLVCSSSIAPQVVLRNNGAVALTSVDIVFDYDGGTPQVFSWTGNLAYNATEIVELPITTVAQGPHVLNVATSNPNGVVDEIPADDANSSSFDASGESATIVIVQDRWGTEITWEVYDALEIAPIASGGPYADLPANGTLVHNENVCLPVTFGNCFTLRILDSFGDGMCCLNGGNGMWQVRATDGSVLLEDDFHGSGTLAGSAIYDGFQSPALGANPTYTGHEFCLPKGSSSIEANECGVMNNTLNNKVYTTAAPGTGPYQFEFSNPDQAFRRRISVTQRYVKFSQMQTNPLVPGITYFARARRDAANDGYFNDNWGSGCDMALDATAVPGCAQLINDTDLPTHSCGVTRSFGYSDKIWATPVLGATQYRFKFEGLIDQDGPSGPIAPVGGIRTITQTSYVRVLNWATYTLVDGQTYTVTVEARVNGIWSGYCGAACSLTIANPPAFADGRSDAAMADGDVLLYPNPVRDGKVNLVLNGLDGSEDNVTVDVFDIFGKRVINRVIATDGATDVTTVIDMGSALASGVYMVDIVIGDRHIAQRLTVQ